jgi:alpha-L-fucosidase
LPSYIEDDLIDENSSLAQVERQIHYAASVLLASMAERWVDQLQRRVERGIDDAAVTFRRVGESQPNLNFLATYLSAHHVIFEKDYLRGPTAHARRLDRTAFLDESLVGDITEVDGRFLDDFIWLRNKIVHVSGLTRKAQLQPLEAYARHVPVEAIDGDENEEPTRFRLAPDNDYLTKVARHFIALFAELVADAEPRVGRGYWNRGE